MLFVYPRENILFLDEGYPHSPFNSLYQGGWPDYTDRLYEAL